jgi:hypothetical protein
MKASDEAKLQSSDVAAPQWRATSLGSTTFGAIAVMPSERW